MAIKLIQLSGLEPYEDIEIKFIGLRPGEKCMKSSSPMQSSNYLLIILKLSIAKIADADFDNIIPKINDALINIYEKTGAEVVEAMMEIVPGYTSEYENAVK